MKVVVTGGLGCIGLELSNSLVKKGYDVTVFDLPESRFLNYEKPKIKYIFGSIMDQTAMLSAFSGADAVIHLAAYLGVQRTETNRLRGIDINVFGTELVIQTAIMCGVKKFVFASSSEIYGDPPVDKINETMVDRGQSVYAISKLVGEELLRAYTECTELQGVILRFFNTFGPRQEPQFVVPTFVTNVVNGLSPLIYGDGSQTRSYCYAEDTADGIVRAMEFAKKGKPEIFNIGNPNNRVNLLELAELICRIYGDGKVSPKITGTFDNADRSADREIFSRVCDISKATNLLGFKPGITLEEGLRKMQLSGMPISRWAQ